MPGTRALLAGSAGVCGWEHRPLLSVMRSAPALGSDRGPSGRSSAVVEPRPPTSLASGVWSRLRLWGCRRGDVGRGHRALGEGQAHRTPGHQRPGQGFTVLLGFCPRSAG